MFTIPVCIAQAPSLWHLTKQLASPIGQNCVFRVLQVLLSHYLIKKPIKRNKILIGFLEDVLKWFGEDGPFIEHWMKLMHE